MKNKFKVALVVLVSVLVIIIVYFYLNKPVSAGEPEFLEVMEVENFSGIVVEKGWAKSHESYCQGGSEYYVLETEKESFTLNSARDPINNEDNYKSFNKFQKQLELLVGKKVIVKGNLVSGTWTQKQHCPPLSQCLLGVIKCNWIRVIEINQVD